MTGWFSKSKIIHNYDIIAKELREARETKGVKLPDAAAKLGISAKYLTAIEDGRLDKLPEGLYGKNYLREYALFLGIDAVPLLELYRSEAGGGRSSQGDIFARKAAQVNYAVNIPRILRNILISSVIVLSLAYLGYSLSAIISPPPLDIFEPADDLTVRESSVNVRGQTIAEASVEINGEEVLTDAGGLFEKRINLKTGLNAIVIRAKKNYSRTHEIVKNVLLEE